MESTFTHKTETSIEGTIDGFNVTNRSAQFVFNGKLYKYYVFALFIEDSVTVTLEEKTPAGPSTSCIYAGRLSDFNMDVEATELKATGLPGSFRAGEREDLTFLWLPGSDHKCSLIFETYEVRA